MPDTDPATEPTTTEPPEPAIGGDGTPYDPQRAQGLIHKLRDRERNTKNNLLGLGLSREAINRAMDTEAGDEPTPSPAADNSELRQLKIHSALIDGISDAGLDRKLTLAALAADKALTDLDPASDSLTDEIADMLDETAAKYPQLRRTYTANGPNLSGSAFPGGASQQPIGLTPADVAAMSPDAVAAAVRAGKFAHIGIPGTRTGRR